MSLYKNHIPSEQDFEIWADNYNKWKSEQPEFIAVELQGTEFSEFLDYCSHIYFKLTIKDLFNSMFAGEQVGAIISGHAGQIKLEKGKFYKKVKNPFRYLEPVIPW